MTNGASTMDESTLSHLFVFQITVFIANRWTFLEMEAYRKSDETVRICWFNSLKLIYYNFNKMAIRFDDFDVFSTEFAINKLPPSDGHRVHF